MRVAWVGLLTAKIQRMNGFEMGFESGDAGLAVRSGGEGRANSASPLLGFGVIAQGVEDLGTSVLGKIYSWSSVCCSNY